MIMKVLVPIDDSDHSRRALTHALDLAENHNALVTVMTVAPAVGSFLDEMRNVQDKLNVEYQGWLDKARQMFEAKGIKVNTILEVGQVPANNIIRRAEDDGFNRIIIGATGRGGLARILMGSTASKVAWPMPLVK
jgi:nucleotide-binding universal stress UspA family protein